MSDLKLTNKADEHIIVGSIEVLGSTKSKETSSIKNSINNLQNSVTSLAEKQNDFWSEISADNVITPVEKKTLKKEMEQIRSTHTAIMEEAEKAGIKTADEIVEYDEAFDALEEYLYDELKVFDDMTINTHINNKEHFNELFDDYYYNQSIAQARISAGAVTAVRTLTTLECSGYEGEVAIYKNKLYKYTNTTHTWEEVATNAYMGALKEFPSPIIDNFFLCVDQKDGQFNDVIFESYIRIDNALLQESKSLKPIKATIKLTTGYIYKYTEKGWKKVTDKNDWRYIVATNDLVEYGYTLSPNLDNKINDIAENKQHLQKYLGVITETPTNYGNGDYFVWNTNTRTWSYSGGTITLETGCLYKFNKPLWAKVNPQDSAYNNEIMAALNDLITIHGGSDAYFNNIFLKKMFALEAVIQELSSKVITLQQNGMIQSENYVTSGGTQGFNIDTNGNINANGNTYIKGHCIIGNENNHIELNDGNIDVSGMIQAYGFENKVNKGNYVLHTLGGYIPSGSTIYKLPTNVNILANGNIKLLITYKLNTQAIMYTYYCKITKENSNGIVTIFTAGNEDIDTPLATINIEKEVEISFKDLIKMEVKVHNSRATVAPDLEIPKIQIMISNQNQLLELLDNITTTVFD